MPDLEMLLRDIRPVPEPAWAAQLDTRVANRFPGPPPRWKAPFIALREHMLALGTLTAVAGGVIVWVYAGVTHDGSEDAEPASSSAKVESMAAATPEATLVPESAAKEKSAPTRRGTTFSQ